VGAELENCGDVEVVGSHEQLTLLIHIKLLDEVALPIILDENFRILTDKWLLDIGGGLSEVVVLAVLNDQLHLFQGDFARGKFDNFVGVIHKGLIDHF